MALSPGSPPTSHPSPSPLSSQAPQRGAPRRESHGPALPPPPLRSRECGKRVEAGGSEQSLQSAFFDPGPSVRVCFLPHKHFDQHFLCAAEEPGRTGAFNSLRAALWWAPWGGRRRETGRHRVDQFGLASRSLMEPDWTQGPCSSTAGSPGESRPRGPERLVNVQACPGAAQYLDLPGEARCKLERPVRRNLLQEIGRSWRTGLHAPCPLARVPLPTWGWCPQPTPRPRLWLSLPPLARSRWGVND